MDERRKAKLQYLFRQAIAGHDEIGTSAKAKLFLEAVCSYDDSVRCIENILGSKNGVAAMQRSVRIDVTTSFINTTSTSFLQYLQNADIEAACGGDLLHTILQYLVDPPTFWIYLRDHAEAGALTDSALQCFAWMLFRLLSISKSNLASFIAVAADKNICARLADAADVETRNLSYKIQQILLNLKASIPIGDNGPGGRHDNDFANFREIALTPTLDEIMSTDLPYLRFASEVDGTDHQHILGAHLDNQFRLLRDDMIREMREELTNRFKKQVPKVDGLVLNGVEIDPGAPWALEFECRSGLFMIPKNLKMDARKDFLQKHKKILSHGAVAAIFVDGVVTGFGTIWRQDDKLAGETPLLHVHLPSHDVAARRILKAIRQSSQISILPLRVALFAYEPILHQLQNIRHIPLAESILEWKPGQSTTFVHLSPSISDLLHKLERDPSLELKHILSLTESVKLDGSQVASLTAGLSQQVALIQGPPGTGKSFIGALVAKALHEHTKHRILVLSYTNHALDQYLEDLIKVGIPASDVVRLGSPFKASAATKSVVLSEKTRLSSHRLTRGDWTVIDSSKQQANDIGMRLKTTFGEFAQHSAKHKDLMEYLEFSDVFQGYFEAFQLPRDNAYKMVNKRGKDAGPYYLLECWLKNKVVHKALQKPEHHDIWRMQPGDRETIKRQWLDDMLAERLNQVIEYGHQYDKEIRAISKVRNECHRRVMADMRLIGCTTTAAAKSVADIQSVQPEIIIVEEAGEILESHILAAIGPETKQLILIGDHKQLRPKCHYELSVEKGMGYDLNRSLFERLILKGYPHQKLSMQHRMRPEISSLIRALTYPELTDSLSTRNRPSIRGLRDDVIFLDHDVSESEGPQAYDPREGAVTSSKTNPFEAYMTLKCVRYMAQQGYGSDKIVVLTPYLGQLRLLYDVLQAENDPVLNDLDSYDLVKAGLLPAVTASSTRSPLRISTIDNYQGEESDLVIVSLTRSNGRGDIGFMAAPERLNVLISRARNGIVLIGNTQTFIQSRTGGELWSKFLGLLRNGQHIYGGLPTRCERHPDKQANLSMPEDFDRFCPDGGCDTPCRTILSCGLHYCPSKCHQLSDHSKMVCAIILTDVCPIGHKLSWQCSSSRPSVCKSCETKKKREEQRKAKEHERLREEMIRKLQHDDQIAEIEAQIECETQRMRDLRLQEEQGRALAQKKADLKQAQKIAGKAEIGKQQELSSTRSRDLRQEKASDPYSADANMPETTSTEKISNPVLNSEQSGASREWDLMKDFENVESDAIEELMEMTGLESVKSWVLQLFSDMQVAKRQNRDLRKERYGMVMLGNPGTGKTTVARIIAKFLVEKDIVTNTQFIETTGSKLANEGVAGTKKMLDALVEDGGGVVFVDEAYQLVSRSSYGGGAVLDFLLAEIENTTGKVVFMFAGYEKQMEKFFQHNPGLASRMPHRLKFADYSESELLHMIGGKLRKKYQGPLRVEDGISGLYMRIAVRRLHRLSGQEGFGNARELENVVSKISSAQAKRITRERRSGQKPDDFYLCKEDIIGPEPAGALQNSRAWQSLQSMVGLDSVKNTVRTLLDSLLVNYKRELKELPILEVSLNKMFLGPPGTGKTTVAKLYGQILAELGMLSTSECVVKTPSDFIGSAMGESEKNTKAILEDAKGKVLVLDEAYMLHSASSAADMYRTAVVDTIVSIVHNVPGDDRAVLLLGYTEQMKEMIRNVNPGLARRFPIEDAFTFEDYDDEQLMAILDYKVQFQRLSVTEEAKKAAIEVLAKLRRRPNFGNAGEVENLLSRAKANAIRRPKTAAENTTDNTILQPQDFDPDFGRNSNAMQSCQKMFEDVIGSEMLVEKLTGYIQSFTNATEIGLDPVSVLPFNFVFKGPPGTGKTTTARKIGRVFCDMGFLAFDAVHECSSTDLVGQYVGQTGPKVIAKFEEALGEVLFVDEAYRLAEGPFAKEAVDELVDCLTKERYKGKMIVVLAGYEDEINGLLKVNPGLSSRFPEEITFEHLTPPLCIDLLLTRLRKNAKFHLDLSLAGEYQDKIAELFSRLSQLSGWANGRDVETIASRIVAAVLKAPKAAGDALKIGWPDIFTQVTRIYEEREKRSLAVNEKLTQAAGNTLQQLIHMPPQPQNPTYSTKMVSKTAPLVSERVETVIQPEILAEDKVNQGRDYGVSDAIWQQLQVDKRRHEQRKATQDRAIQEVERAKAAFYEQAAKEAAKVEEMEKKATLEDDARHALERRRLIAAEAKRKADEEAEKLHRMLEERRKAQEQEQKVQMKLREMGVCCMGFQWIKQSGGYRCAGGSHWVSDSQLGI